MVRAAETDANEGFLDFWILFLLLIESIQVIWILSSCQSSDDTLIFFFSFFFSRGDFEFLCLLFVCSREVSGTG